MIGQIQGRFSGGILSGERYAFGRQEFEQFRFAFDSGQMQGRLVTSSDEQKARAAKMGVKDFNKKFSMEEMASGDVIFAATGVTDGTMLEGIRHVRGGITTHSIVMRSSTGTVRWVSAHHNFAIKTGLPSWA